ncbi:MAG TPA: twin-arginine translocase TatA/TatE family subunit [Granulicella sp.]|jgi:sec-independent protein translocase protein TatB|nr:twin-arginine translocase TatA/TatE family subunit [Granulicella sp.]
MPSLGDSAFIFLLALILFGPKRLPELARQIGKLMGEFRRASNEFRLQMEEELRISEQAEKQKKIAELQAAAPVAPALPPPGGEDHPHLRTAMQDPAAAQAEAAAVAASAPVQPESEPLPIATSGDLNILPPATGLPTPHSSSSSSSSLAPFINAVPRVEPHTPEPAHTASEETLHG